MLIAQNLFFLRIAEVTLGGSVRIRGSPLAYAPPANKHLSLQQMLALAGLTLHMVDRVPMFYVGVETKNHVLGACDFRE